MSDNDGFEYSLVAIDSYNWCDSEPEHLPGYHDSYEKAEKASVNYSDHFTSIKIVKSDKVNPSLVHAKVEEVYEQLLSSKNSILIIGGFHKGESRSQSYNRCEIALNHLFANYNFELRYLSGIKTSHTSGCDTSHDQFAVLIIYGGINSNPLNELLRSPNEDGIHTEADICIWEGGVFNVLGTGGKPTGLVSEAVLSDSILTLNFGKFSLTIDTAYTNN
ncbi:hypothetical protein [uncultured Pseudoteredinibacter sp.]|uniref:hypothetical protein n=1 Tax=uncultured Pseudoteredinibacter sp. TaxID=1641701 RepID=UPI0026311721|nr:hypothetical protein [uncultured Pseudoteredinibacter sp.]